MKVIAVIKALFLAFSMAMFLLTYAVSCIFKKNTPERAFRLRRRWLTWMAMPVMGIKVEVEGKFEQTPALYVCNHRSFSDPIINLAFIDAYIVAKAEIANYPVINKGAEMTGVLWVKRDSLLSRKNTRESIVKAMLDGYNVIVYPEGTVGITPHTRKFSKGTFAEAAKYGIAVVPIALEYRDTKDMWQNRSLPNQYFRQFGKGKTYVKMSIGAPIRSDEGAVLVEKSHTWINNKLAEIQKDWSRVDWENVEAPIS